MKEGILVEHTLIAIIAIRGFNHSDETGDTGLSYMLYPSRTEIQVREPSNYRISSTEY